MTTKDKTEIEKIFFRDFKPATARFLKAAFRFDRNLRKAFENVLRSAFDAAFCGDACAHNNAVEARNAAIEEFSRLPITEQQTETLVNEIVRAVHVYRERLTEQRGNPVIEKSVADLERLVAAIRKLPYGFVRERAEAFASSLVERIETLTGANAEVIRKSINADWHTYRSLD